MEKMNNLRDLLRHEVEDLYSAEEQILAALPAMIEKANNTSLKNALKEHLRITEEHKARLDQVMTRLQNGSEGTNNKKKGILGIFGGKHKCKGMEGIIHEGNKILAEDMDPDVKDAAIIASAQKVEHYEICGYGTARSFAEELGLTDVANLLEETLDEEYEADDKLTFLAESRINRKAESTGSTKTGSSSARGDSSRETARDSVRRKEMEAELVSSGRSRSQESNGRSGSSAAPKGTAPRTTASRPAAKKSASKTAAKKTGRR